MPIPNPPTREDLLNLYMAYLIANSPLTNLQPTSTAVALGAANAALLEEWYQALNLQTPQAVQDGLYSLFNFNALPATPSQVLLTFSGTAGTVIPPGATVSTLGTATTPPITFSTTASGVIGSAGYVTGVPAQSVQTGASTNVPAGSIIQLLSPIIGVTAVTNPQPATGGSDAESPSAQKQRFQQYLASLMGATPTAIQYGLGPVNQTTVSKIAVIPPFALTVYSAQGSQFVDLSASMASPKGVPQDPFSPSPQVGDALYIGTANWFNKLYFDVAQTGSGWSLAWQYWSGSTSSWATLTPTLDQTNFGQQSGTVTWAFPSDWTPTTVNGTTAFWIRLVVQSTTYTTMPTYYQILPLTPPPGFVEIAVVPPPGTPGSVTLQTLQPQLPQWVGAAESGILTLATQQPLNLAVTVTPTLYGASILTQGTIANALTQFVNNLGIGQPFLIPQATYQLQTLYNGEAVASVVFTEPTTNVYVPVDTLLVPGTITVTIEAV